MACATHSYTPTTTHTRTPTPNPTPNRTPNPDPNPDPNPNLYPTLNPDPTPNLRLPLPLARYAAYAIGVLGSIHLKRAVVAGQYHRPDGLFYGGLGFGLALGVRIRVGVRPDGLFYGGLGFGLGARG